MRRYPKPRAPPSGDRLLAEEVLYLHSLWLRGPPIAPPAPAPPRRSGSLATRSRANQRKRRRLGRFAESDDPGGTEWPLAPSPPASPTPSPWPDASASNSSSSPAPPVQQPSPGSLAQRAAIRAAEEFFSGHTSGDDAGSESEGDDGGEEDAAGFFMGLFERDAALRGYYERSWEDGQFMCMGCAARKARRGKARRFRGCVGLVQHARAATRCGRPRAHCALAAAICRVLGWDIERLPSVVIDPGGTLGQALVTEGAAATAHEAKENVDSGEHGGSSSDEDAPKEDGGPGKSGSSSDEDVTIEDVNTGKNDSLLSDRDAAKEDVGTKKSVRSSNDNDGEVHEQENGIGSTEKEDIMDIDPLSSKDTSKIEELCKTVLEEEAGKENNEDHAHNAVGTGDNDNAILGINSMDSSKS